MIAVYADPYADPHEAPTMPRPRATELGLAVVQRIEELESLGVVIDDAILATIIEQERAKYAA